MENKLGRKSMQDWKEMTDALTMRVYKSGFDAGYDAAKDETPDVDEVAELLIERYTDVEPDTITALLHDVISHKVVKSANEQRAELIQRAREFVEEHTKKKPADDFFDKPYIELPNPIETCVTEEFFVNADKRAVTCLLKGVESNRIWFKGIAKCMPDEVFNADIGKAIALARALEIDVPDEFIHAVQPNEKVIGMGVHVKNSLYGRYTLLGIGDFAGYVFATLDSNYGLNSTIIDDTNARYNEVN